MIETLLAVSPTGVSSKFTLIPAIGRGKLTGALDLGVRSNAFKTDID